MGLVAYLEEHQRLHDRAMENMIPTSVETGPRSELTCPQHQPSTREHDRDNKVYQPASTGTPHILDPWGLLRGDHRMVESRSALEWSKKECMEI